MNRWIFATILMLSAGVLMACSIGTQPDQGSGGAAATGTSTAPACSEGEPCALGPYCCGGFVLLQCFEGAYVPSQACTEPTAECDALAGTCTCKQGAKQCLSPTTEQVCVGNVGGVNVLQEHECAPGVACQNEVGCGSQCVDICVVGERKCSDDLADLQECVRPNPASCSVFQSVFSCAAHGMKCDVPDFPTSQLIQHCLNECGGRGIEPVGKQCDHDPNVPCGFLVCDVAAGNLKGDHVGCLGGGLPCNSDDECGSCHCEGDVCIGDKFVPCAESVACPH